MPVFNNVVDEMSVAREFVAYEIDILMWVFRGVCGLELIDVS